MNTIHQQFEHELEVLIKKYELKAMKEKESFCFIASIEHPDEKYYTSFVNVVKTPARHLKQQAYHLVNNIDKAIKTNYIKQN